MPRLSVTIIAKNEERNLARCLESVANVADEIIVVDTGSTDQTLEIARRFGVRVASFEWIDDFSAAHNYCNGLAAGDWIFMLDADEELLPESREELARCLEEERVLGYSVLRQDLVDPSRLDHYTEMWQVRLFRNRPDLRFVGRFHHHFSPPLAAVAARAGLELRESSVRIRHYGYVAGLKDEKNQRAVRLLELELADRPEQFYYLVELGLTRLAVGDARGHERLVEAARMVADGRPEALQAGGPLAMLLEHVLASPKLPEGFPLTRAQARELALAKFPDAVPLLWHLAVEQHSQGRFDRCARLLERIVALGEAHSYSRLVSFDPKILGDDARLNLGVCYVRLGQVQKARRLFRALVESPTRGREAVENLKALDRLGRG